MKVSEVMTAAPEVARPDSTLQEVAEKMRTLDIGPLPVCDTNNRLVGILTDRDITIRATAEGCDPYLTYVQDVMTDSILYIFENQDVKDAARMMEENQVRRLAVLDQGKNLVGIISLGDIALSDLDDDVTSETLEQISVPSGGVPVG